MKDLRKENIIQFLDDWSDDNGLISPFINSISRECYENTGNLSFHFPYCNSINEKLFWKSHIVELRHLYVYAFLYDCAKTFSSESFIKRCNEFASEFKEKLLVEMDNFVKLKTSMPQSVLCSLAFLVDEFLWTNRTNILQLFPRIEDDETKKALYADYSNLFLLTLQREKDIINKIGKYLDFCEITDKSGFTDCFRGLLNKLINDDFKLEIHKEEIPNALTTLTQPIVGENPYKYKFSLLKKILDFCCDYHETYNISDEIISKIIYNIVCNRINEYILCYYSFVNKEKCVEYLKGYSPNTSLFEWISRVYPWNSFEYYQEKGLNDLVKIITEEYFNFEYKCDKIIEDVLVIIRKIAGKEWYINSKMVNQLESLTQKMLNEKNQVLKDKLICHFQSYKKEKCIEIVNKAIIDVNTSDYINERLNEANLIGEVVVDCSECIIDTNEQDARYSKISIRVNNNELFSIEKDRNDFYSLDKQRIEIGDGYCKKVADSWLDGGGMDVSVKKEVCDEKQREYHGLIADYKNKIREFSIFFKRRYLDYEYFYKKSGSESYCDRDESYDDYMWKHGY